MATFSQYRVVAGDTLGKIAKKFKTTVAAIAKANNITNVNKIKAGATLSIPVNESTPVIDTVPKDPILTEGSVSNPFSAVAPAAKAAGWFQPPKLYYLIGAAALFILLANRTELKPYYDGK